MSLVMADSDSVTEANKPSTFFISRDNSVSDTSPESAPVDPSYKHKVLKPSGTGIVYNDFELGNYAKILVLYTGGTIGMKSKGGVYSPEPNFLVPQLRNLPMFHDKEFHMHLSPDDREAPLVMQLSKEGKRVIYSVYEYEPLLDSANITFDDYARLAKDIKDNYDQFDGFVILHGTDTMAYTASALSFMFENLGKPVILTGSQIPIFETRSDGRDNFLGALILAGHYCIPEVTLYFHNVLLRGNRSEKTDTGAFDAFTSANMEPLVKMEINVHVNWDSVLRPVGMEKFNVHTHMCPNVGILRLFPSITDKTVKAFLQPPMEGIVIQSYGAGNGPDARSDLMQIFREASDRGLLIVNITQCQKGTVSTSYATGKALLDAGVLPGSDMTPEAALMKLSYVLSKQEWSLDKKRKMVRMNLRGEMKVAMKQEISLFDFTLIEKMAESMRLTSSEEIQLLRQAIFPSLLCAAAKEGSVAALEKLKHSGANFGLGDYDGRTALHVAVCEGHIEAVNYLLQNGALVHVKDRYGHTPLDDAVRFKRHALIKILCKTGAHLSMPPGKLGMILCNSAFHEDVEMLKAWYLAGIDLNQADYTRRTVLHVATACNNVEMVKYLLSTGLQASDKDIFGFTPLDIAKTNECTEIESLLKESLENGER